MSQLCSYLNWKHRLMITTLLLGLAALMIGSPASGSRAVVDTRELALAVEGELDHVTPAQLAEWLIAERADFRLLDLRSEAAYDEYHIPTAEHVALSALSDYPLLRNEKIVLYSEGGIHAAQAWFLLRARDYRRVYILKGGIEGWSEEILFPVQASERARQISTHFGGSPQTDDAAQTPQVKKPLPKLESPAGGAAPAGGMKKKKKEGC